MRRSLDQTETSSEAVLTVLTRHLADATQLVNCSTAAGQQPRNSCRQGAFLLAERYKCRRLQTAVGIDQCLRRADSLRPNTVLLCCVEVNTLSVDNDSEAARRVDSTTLTAVSRTGTSGMGTLST